METLVVVDTSVVVKWFRLPGDEAAVKEALALLEKHLGGEITLAAPELLWYEFGNVLWQRQELSLTDKVKTLEDLQVLNLVFHAFNLKQYQSILGLAQKHGITFYDAAFLALSEFLEVDLVTADKKLYQKIGGTKGIKLLGA
jgi:predicted nucleic acid-binding protein